MPRLFASLLRPVFAVVVAFAFAATAHAQLGSRTTEQWLKTLDAANRVAKLKVDEAVAALQLRPGAIVADIGAGSGAFTAQLAAAAGAQGKVYAVDIEQGLVDHIAQRMRDQGVKNVQAVLGGFTDPKLPTRDLDLAFIFDVLHHIEKRPEYLKALATYLKPTGRIAIVDFHPELGPHKDDPTLHVTREQAKAWLATLGFRPVGEPALYTDKWYVVYAR